MITTKIQPRVNSNSTKSHFGDTKTPTPNGVAKPAPNRTPTKVAPTVRLNAVAKDRIATWTVKRQLEQNPTGKPVNTTTRPAFRNVVITNIAVNAMKKPAEKQTTVIENRTKTKPAEMKPLGKLAASGTQTSGDKPASRVKSAVQAFEQTSAATQPSTPKKTTVEIVKKIESKVTKKPEPKYVDLPIKTPAIQIKVKPWSEGPQIVAARPDTVRQLSKKGSAQALIEESTDKKTTPDKDKEDTLDEKSTGENAQLRWSSWSIGEDADVSTRNSLGDDIEYNHPRAIDLVRRKAGRYWMDVSSVKDSGLLETLTKEERMRQEAKFEVMFSEASYLNNLNLLKAYYMTHIQKHIPQVLTNEDYNILFSHVLEVRDCSEKFLREMDDHWQNDLLLNDIYDIVSRYAGDQFRIYIRYCRNMLEMQKHLVDLTTKNDGFKSLLGVLMKRENVQKLSLDSFLTSPMQRITKLPLLMKTILGKLEFGSEEYKKCTQAYEAASKIAQECDEVVTEKKRLEELLRLSQQIEFPSEIKSIPIVIPNRTVVALGDVKHFAFVDGSTKKEKLKLLLFSDILLVAKKKSEKHFLVVDHCPRDQVTAREMENPQLYGHQDQSQTITIIISMACNSVGKKVDLMVTFKEPNASKKWLEYLTEEKKNVRASVPSSLEVSVAPTNGVSAPADCHSSEVSPTEVPTISTDDTHSQDPDTDLVIT